MGANLTLYTGFVKVELSLESKILNIVSRA